MKPIDYPPGLETFQFTFSFTPALPPVAVTVAAQPGGHLKNPGVP